MLKRIIVLLFVAVSSGAAGFCAEGSIAICPTGRCAVRCGRVFGGENADMAYSVEETQDGGYFAAGFTTSFGQRGDAWLVGLDSKGNWVWDKTFGGKGRDEASSMCMTNDGGVILSGSGFSEDSGSSDFLVVKLDSKGNLKWEKLFDDAGNEYAKAAAPTSDGGVIIAGNRVEPYYKDGPKPRDGVIMKLDASGNREWSKRFGSGGVNEDLYSIRQTSDGGYVAVGSSGREKRAGAKNDIWVFKLDESGNEEWSKVLEGEGMDLVSSVVQAPDGGYILAGFTSTPRDKGDLWIMKLSASGDPEWEELYGDRGKDEATSIEKTSDGGYIVAGYTTFANEGILLRLDEEGYIVWVKTYGGEGRDILVSALETSDGGFIAAGQTNSFGAQGVDFWVMKVDGDGNCEW
ncbi:MAG: PQQ-binding-like beta-propeller repeat protein [bacterium]